MGGPGGVRREGWVGRGQGGCERRIEGFVKIQKKMGGGVWGGGRGSGEVGRVRVDVIEELKFLGKFCGGGGGVGWLGGITGWM